MTHITRIAVRWPGRLLAVWLAAVAVLAVIGVPMEERLAPARLVLPGTSSATWDELREGRFGDDTVLLLRGPPAALDAQGPQLTEDVVRRTGAPVVSPWSGLPGVGRQLRPEPGLALIVVDLSRGEHTVDLGRLEAFERYARGRVRPPLQVDVTGAAPLQHAIARESLEAAATAERLAIPILLLVLLLVFRSPLAAVVPLLVAGATVLAGRGVLVILAQVVHLDVVAAVLLSMIGLALGVDYSLLIVTRFREALAAGEAPNQAAALAAHTAGRTATFAGITLMAILGVTLLLAPPGTLVSAVAGAIVATVLGVVGALVATPAMLILLGRRVRPLAPERGGIIGRVTSGALRRPRTAAVLAAVPLLVIALAVLRLDTIPPDARALPAGSPGHEAFAAVTRAGLGPGFEVVLHSPSGPVTDPASLRAERRLERGLARLPSVRSVAGPGAVGEAVQTASDRQLATLRRGLSRARRGLGALRTGLGQAGDGATRLAGGGAQAGTGAARLADGAGRAREGADALAEGSDRARAGARDFAAGLAQAAKGARALRDGSARLQTGAARTADGAGELADTLNTRLVPALDQLARGLAEGATGLGALREPARTAATHAQGALDALRAMTVGLVDPRYRRAVEDAGTALAAITGKDPRTGADVRSGYRGLDAELAGASDQAAEAADGARRLAAGGREAVRGARRLRDAARVIERGLGELRAGAVRLGSGLDRLAGGAREAGDGLGALARGGGSLTGGLSQLRASTAQLARGLDRLQAGQATLARRLRQAGGSLQEDPFAGQSVRAPALLRSGFASVAALDTAGARRRAAGRYVLDVDRGGDTARIVLLTGLEPDDPRAPAVLRSVQRLSADFSRATGEQAGVGGLAAQLVQFDEATQSRLPLIVLGIVVVTFLALVPVLRSLLLPAIAVGLNLLTVLATFGVLTWLFVGEEHLLGGTGALDVISVCSVFAVVFALSIDYQVFLLARMREGYVLTQDAVGAIRFGVEHTARIVTGAALIMLGVFAAFSTTNVANVQQFGIGLGVAILIDATLVRLVLLPAVMRLAGPRTWWLPDRLERRLPELDVEGVGYVRSREEMATRAAELW